MKYCKLKKSICSLLTIGLLASSLVGCGSTEENTTEEENTTQQETTNSIITPEATGEIDIMIWSGDGVYHEDIGSKDWQAEDITAMNVAAVYAMAKDFKETYPNIKINLYAKIGDPNGNEVTWQQEMENFKAEHGKYPDIYASTDLPGDVTRGLVADLSVYKDDPIYKSFNEAIMGMMNYGGVQAGLPQYLLPWGVYVNKELADQNNIDVPEPNWTIDEYTEIATSGDNETFYGSMDAPLSFINTGTKDIFYKMTQENSAQKVDLTTESVSNLLDYVPEWSTSAVWALFDDGKVSEEFMTEHDWWGYNFFARNKVLTYDGDPWQMGSAGMPEGTPGTVESGNWDIYPRPSTADQDNTVGIVIDPMAIHNYSMDDGNPEWSEEEKEQLDVSYAFASYWVGAEDSMKARANQMFNANGTLMSSLNDSLPLVTGDEFNKQMEVWYSTENHKRYQDAELMPGFQEVVRIWEEGNIWDISDKTHLFYTTEDGQQVQCMYEWLGSTNPAIAGFKKTDAGWLDNTKSKLADWTETINARFVKAEEELNKSLKDYYGVSE